MAYGRTCINIFVGVKGRQKEEKKGRRGDGKKEAFEYMFIYVCNTDRKSRELNLIYLES